MKVLKIPEETLQDPHFHFQAEVPCKELPYFRSTEKARGALLLVNEEDVDWSDYDLPASGGRGPRDAGTAFFTLCSHCNGLVYLADTRGHLDKVYLTNVQAMRIRSSKPEFDWKKQ